VRPEHGHRCPEAQRVEVVEAAIHAIRGDAERPASGT
jgi:hypothetical protein